MMSMDWLSRTSGIVVVKNFKRCRWFRWLHFRATRFNKQIGLVYQDSLTTWKLLWGCTKYEHWGEVGAVLSLNLPNQDKRRNDFWSAKFSEYLQPLKFAFFNLIGAHLSLNYSPSRPVLLPAYWADVRSKIVTSNLTSHFDRSQGWLLDSDNRWQHFPFQAHRIKVQERDVVID